MDDNSIKNLQFVKSTFSKAAQSRALEGGSHKYLIINRNGTLDLTENKRQASSMRQVSKTVAEIAANLQQEQGSDPLELEDVRDSFKALSKDYLKKNSGFFARLRNLLTFNFTTRSNIAKSKRAIDQNLYQQYLAHPDKVGIRAFHHHFFVAELAEIAKSNSSSEQEKALLAACLNCLLTEAEKDKHSPIPFRACEKILRSASPHQREAFKGIRVKISRYYFDGQFEKANMHSHFYTGGPKERVKRGTLEMDQEDPSIPPAEKARRLGVHYDPHSERALQKYVYGPDATRVSNRKKSPVYPANFISASKNGPGCIAATPPSRASDVGDFLQTALQSSHIVRLASPSETASGDTFLEYIPNHIDEVNSFQTPKGKKYQVQLLQREKIDLNGDDLSQYAVKHKVKVTGPDGKTRELDILEYIGWPDRGSPDLTAMRQFMALSKEIQAKSPQKRREELVHCSSGVGRTGVYAALRGLPPKSTPDEIIKGITKMRNERNTEVVQSSSQAAFIFAYLNASTATVDDQASLREKQRYTLQASYELIASKLHLQTGPATYNFEPIKVILPDENDVLEIGNHLTGGAIDNLKRLKELNKSMDDFRALVAQQQNLLEKHGLNGVDALHIFIHHAPLAKELLKISMLQAIQAQSDQLSQELKSVRPFGSKDPLQTQEMSMAFESFKTIEASGTATKDLFWKDASPRTEAQYFGGTTHLEPFAVHLAPEPKDELIVFGDIESSDRLVSDLSNMVDASYKLKNPHHKLIFTGNLNAAAKDSPEIFYHLMRLKIANPHQVFILRDQDDPYEGERTLKDGSKEFVCDTFMNEMLEVFSSRSDEHRKDQDLLIGMKSFYRFLPSALLLKNADNGRLLVCNDALKLKINPFTPEQSGRSPFQYFPVGAKVEQPPFTSSETNRTLKFSYQNRPQSIRFNEHGYPVTEATRSYINPYEIECIAKELGFHFDYSKSEKHIYLESDSFVSREGSFSIQYLNSFLSEISSLVKNEPDKYPEIVRIWKKPKTEKGDLAAIYRLAPASIKKAAQSYKIHLMPNQAQITPLIHYLMREMPKMDEKARKALAGVKILTWDQHLKVQHEKTAMHEPTPPTIVIYLVAQTPLEAQDTLNALFALLEKHPELHEGSGIAPRFNAQCSSMMYVAQGTGPDKEVNPDLIEKVKALKQKLKESKDPMIAQMLQDQIKSLELNLEIPDLFTEDMAFFRSDLDGTEYRLSHPRSKTPVKGDTVDNGTDAFRRRLAE